jgi:hypothetical protein
MLHRGVYDQDTLFECDLNADSVAARTEFIELRDIRRIEKDIEAEAVRLHPDDGQSILKWVERLKAKGYLLGFKSKTDPAPPGSGLAPDLFLLMIQTDWQRSMFAKYGEKLVCIDATHNVTMYENLNLTTLVVRDRWGHGKFLLVSCSSLIRCQVFLLRGCSHRTEPKQQLPTSSRYTANALPRSFHVESCPTLTGAKSILVRTSILPSFFCVGGTFYIPGSSTFPFLLIRISGSS